MITLPYPMLTTEEAARAVLYARRIHKYVSNPTQRVQWLKTTTCG